MRAIRIIASCKSSRLHGELRSGLTTVGMPDNTWSRLALKGTSLTPPASGESHTWGFLFFGVS
jgi:hypothetical protein